MPPPESNSLRGLWRLVIADNLDDYPHLAVELMQQPERRAQLGHHARRFAEAYDYQRVYQRYLDLLATANNTPR